jgi:glutamine amidotransferase
MKKVCILDYGIGNLKSLSNAFIRLGADTILSSKHKEILGADYLILPGVGAFANAMEKLKNLNLDNVILEFIRYGRPFMGICLGMQMLFEKSEEFGITDGIGIIEGDVIKIPIEKKVSRLPNIGWNNLVPTNFNQWDNSILKGLSEEDRVYFIHSFCCKPKQEKDILAKTFYEEIELCASVQRGNIIGVQFHPEKSGPVGLKILNQFLNFKH